MAMYKLKGRRLKRLKHYDKLDEYLDRLEKLRQLAKDDRAMIELYTDMALNEMRSNELKSYRGVTLVTPTRVEPDWEALRKALPAKIWEQITIVKPDPHKLEKAIERGLIPASLVRRHSSMKESAAYLRFSA